MTEGKLKAIIDTAFDFEDVPKAYESLRTGRAKGKSLCMLERSSTSSIRISGDDFTSLF